MARYESDPAFRKVVHDLERSGTLSREDFLAVSRLPTTPTEAEEASAEYQRLKGLEEALLKEK